METGEQLATVTVLHPVQKVDIEAPFRKFREAGLVNSQFGIDGLPPLFWGYHHPGHLWNGWDTPSFEREVVTLIIDWLNEQEPAIAWWDGNTLNVRNDGGGYVDRVEPDELGLYRFDGWTWVQSAATP